MIDPLTDSPDGTTGPYALDVTITLPSGGTVTFQGRGLDPPGMRDLLDVIRRAVGDG